MSYKQLLTDHYEAFLADMEKFEAGNKAAGTRARKSLSEIGKVCKELRKHIQDVKNSDK